MADYIILVAVIFLGGFVIGREQKRWERHHRNK